MAMSASDMVTKIRANQAGITPSPNEGETPDAAYADAILEAFCQGIIDEIIESAEVATTAGAPDSEHTGNITG